MVSYILSLPNLKDTKTSSFPGLERMPEKLISWRMKQQRSIRTFERSEPIPHAETGELILHAATLIEGMVVDEIIATEIENEAVQGVPLMSATEREVSTDTSIAIDMSTRASPRIDRATRTITDDINWMEDNILFFQTNFNSLKLK